ncbi:unnamed protein product [Calicophoron daubneyi]|uniref:Rhodanese domain-containing protein n=1 Tax=Calicophoron daubneyi TaxID=300641 RepID=A0AAV2TFR4_CALDB
MSRSDQAKMKWAASNHLWLLVALLSICSPYLLTPGQLFFLPSVGLRPVHITPEILAKSVTNSVFSVWKDEGRIIDIDVHQLRKMLKEGNVTLIDVREAEELENVGRFDGAIHIPLADVGEAFEMSPQEFLKKYKIQKPAKDDRRLVFCCRSGRRSLIAVRIIDPLGYKWALNLKGGYLDWSK